MNTGVFPHTRVGLTQEDGCKRITFGELGDSPSRSTESPIYNLDR
jgi:hypothetical protein